MEPRLHELNRAFRWETAGSPGGGSTGRGATAAHALAYDEAGYFVLEDALGPDRVDALVAAIDPIERQREDELRRHHGGAQFIARAGEITFSTHLVEESGLLRAFVASPPLTDLCADLVGPDVRLYWDQAVYKKPGTASSFPWHQDNGYTFIEPQQYLTCWIALTDATVDNGCPWVVPGLHRLGTLAHELGDHGMVCLRDPAGAVPVPVRRGGIVVFSSLTPHCTGPNRTGEVRKAYIVQYCPAEAVNLRPRQGAEPDRVPVADPSRQFPVLEAGAAAAPRRP